MENIKHSQIEIDKFWQGFLESSSLPKDTKYLEVFHFEITEKWANELLRLVLIGQKKATASSLWSYEIEGSCMPQIGDLSIVTDWNGIPRCVIETTAINIIYHSMKLPMIFANEKEKVIQLFLGKKDILVFSQKREVI